MVFFVVCCVIVVFLCIYKILYINLFFDKFNDSDILNIVLIVVICFYKVVLYMCVCFE